MAFGGVDAAFTFDTTGSIYPVLGQVRRRLREMTQKLFREVPNLRMGFIAHGDYCDARSYVTRQIDLTGDPDRLYDFISSVPHTDGGDIPECYELVLHEARQLRWGSGKKILVVIGDSIPHPSNYYLNTKRLDWRNELDLLVKMGVRVYGVQAMNYDHATSFYQEMAERTGGCHLRLEQFSEVSDILMAICFQQMGDEALQGWEDQVSREGRMNRGIDRAFAVLTRRKSPSKRFHLPVDLEIVPPWRFQVLQVDRDQSISDFVEDNDLIFQRGHGFYELTKKETIQGNKEVVLRHDATGDFYTGGKARELLGLPRIGSIRMNFTVPKGFTAFVQSTSVNRKLIGGTEFLYEVDTTR